MAPGTPAAVIASGTRPEQRTASGHAGDDRRRAAARPAGRPAITLVGEVAALHDRLAWFERRPLFGRTDRRHPGAGAGQRAWPPGSPSWARACSRRRRSASSRCPSRARRLARTTIVCLTSANGVELLLDERRPRAGGRAGRGDRDAPRLRRSQRRGIEPDVVPPRAMSEGLLEALGDVAGRRVLVATAEGARDVLPDGLRAARGDGRGARSSIARVRRAGRRRRDRRRRPGHVHVVVDGGHRARRRSTPTGSARLRAVSIGPVTSATLRAAGVEPVAEAEPHDVDGLVAAVLAVARIQ